jgi:hypothetical protein
MLQSNLLKSILLSLLLITGSCSHYPAHIGISEVRRTPAAVLNCNDLIEEILDSSFIRAKQKFSRSLSKHYNATEVARVEKNLDALLFVDYVSSIDELAQFHRLSQNIASDDFSNLYGRRSFNNYLKASKYLMQEKPEFNLATLKNVHARMMDGGIDDIPANRIGILRSEDIIGNVPASYSITEESYNALKENIYIDVSRMSRQANGKYAGYIGYPNAKFSKTELLDKIKGFDNQLYLDIKAFRETGTGNFEELTNRMVNGLTEDLLAWFVKKRDQMGDITTVAKFKKFAMLVGEFQKDLISIHPFYDGNGRSVRQFALYYPFWREGFPPPRLVDPNADLYTSDEKWAEQIVEGMHNSVKLYSRMSERLEAGYPIESTPELLLPKIPEEYSMRLLGPRTGKITEGHKKAAVDPFQASEFFLARMQDRDIQMAMQKDAGGTYRKLMDEFDDFMKRSSADYDHARFGREHVHVDFVDMDFMATFANKAYKETKLWKEKIDRWYMDQTLWRGLSRSDAEIEESEILSMFSSVHYQFVSNRMMGQMNRRLNENQVKALAWTDFLDYNRGLVDGDLEKMATDHSESGPRYGSSYGYSTSTKRDVGKAFAMGAMVIADYGAHREQQHLLKSRVLVGMKRAKKDVDLMRLKQVRPEFSYKYFRQSEVMGIGAADPDSVMFVQLIDADGSVIHSYVRNPARPNEIQVFDGEVSDLADRPARPSRVLRLP